MRGEQDYSDVDDWEEREASRTHSVKFSDVPTMEKETPFIRQNTPHPKELKAKAQKLLAKSRQEEQAVTTATAAAFAADIATPKVGEANVVVSCPT